MKIHVILIVLLLTHDAVAQTPFFPVYKQTTDSWVFLDNRGNEVREITNPTLEAVKPIHEGLAAAKDKSTQLWGFLDTAGNWKITPQYDEVDDFLNGHAIVRKHCKTNCYTGNEGLLSATLSYIINTQNQVVLTDRSQADSPIDRFFLDKNLGDGLFRIVYGYGLGDMKTVINLQGNALCDVYSVFGRGDIEYDSTLRMLRCWNKFYTNTGNLLLNLDTYSFVGMYRNGYLWADEEHVVKDDSTVVWRVLLDSTGKEVARFNSDQYQLISDVENHKFRYVNTEFVTMEYDLHLRQSRVYEAPYTLEYDLTAGALLPNGARLVLDWNGELVGFVSIEGVYFPQLAE